MLLRKNARSELDGRPRSSTALITQRQRPSGSGRPSSVRPLHESRYVPGSFGPVCDLPRDPVRPDEARGDGRGADELEAQRLRLGDSVAVRRDDRLESAWEPERRSRRRRGRPRRSARRRGRRAGSEARRRRPSSSSRRIERAGGDCAQPDHRLGELEVGHARAVARLAAVDRGEDDAPVCALADCGARMAKRELVARELLERAEDRPAVLDDERPTADRVARPRPTAGAGSGAP